jgi:hypothetical protein
VQTKLGDGIRGKRNVRKARDYDDIVAGYGKEARL